MLEIFRVLKKINKFPMWVIQNYWWKSLGNPIKIQQKFLGQLNDKI